MRIFKHPVKKLTLIAAFAGAYVLGAKAGRARYEQILQVANQVKDDPRVQEAAARAEDLAREAATKVTEDPRLKDVVSRAEDVLRDAGLKQDPPASPATHPLLKDEHIDLQDEVVYSTGPDIEETIDELADVDVADEIIGGQHRDNS